MNQLVHQAASILPNVLDYWDERQEVAIDNPGDDRLAGLIAWELYETFDPDADDEQQITTAIGAMQRAADCLADVAEALNHLAVDTTRRRAA